MTDSLTQLISDKAVCRTAPATPGLLIIYVFKRLGIAGAVLQTPSSLH